MKKETVELMEYRGGYTLVSSAELEALFRAYRDGLLKKAEFRVWAAGKERGSLHPSSKVTCERILNCKAKEKGISRIRRGAAKSASARLAEVLAHLPEAGRKKAVSRQLLRAISQGRLSCAETVVSLMYSLRRIQQKKPLKRLLPLERYARFTYRNIEEVSGVPRANVCRAVSSLKAKGFLSTVWVVKQNENQFGLLFVDGSALTVVPGAAADRSQPEVRKKPTPPPRNDNSPQCKSTTLINSYPKTVNQENKGFLSRGRVDPDWERIQRRAKAMRENELDQAA